MSNDGDENQPRGYTLSGAPAEPLPASWARPSTSNARVGRVGDWNSSGSQPSRASPSGGPRISTLRDIGSSGGGGGMPPMGRPAPGDDSDDDEDGPRGPQNFFAGGERSGLSIQNPDRAGPHVPGGDMVRDLLRRAAEAGPAPAPGSEVSRNPFGGGGHTLGSDDVESSYVPDPNAMEEEEEETVIRRLTFWRDGFSVEDGELMRYDDPNNESVLAEINAGRAPPSILNAAAGQPVELRVERRIDENYVAPKRVGGFFGSGQRLGAPVPSSPPTAGSSSTMPGSFREAPVADKPLQPQTKFEVDQTQPTTSIQIRLADGTRMVCRMNLTHTVGDIRNFINASRPENLTRPYTIGTTFPNKTLEDNTQSVDSAGLKNSVIVQRWA